MQTGKINSVRILRTIATKVMFPLPLLSSRENTERCLCKFYIHKASQVVDGYIWYIDMFKTEGMSFFTRKGWRKSTQFSLDEPKPVKP